MHNVAETNDTIPQNHPVAPLLRRAAVACGLGRALAVPDEQTVASVLEAMTQGEGLAEREAFEAVRKAWRGMDTQRLAEQHTALFAGNCKCPPYETAWGDGKRMGGRTYELANIAGAYRAFGMGLSEDHRDRPDYVATELEFIGVLLLKLAWAQADGLEEAALVTREALADFVRDHAGRWLDAFAEALAGHDAPATYLSAARAAAAFVAAECERLKVAPDRIEAEVACDDSSTDCFTCPMAEPKEPKPKGRNAPMTEAQIQASFFE
jgi:TorA maturation chaperone TorD